MHRVRVGVALAVVGVLAVVAGCGQNQFRYVDNSTEGAFFKVPSGWKLYRVKAATPTDRLAPQATSDGRWQVVFDSAAKPDETHVDDPAPKDIVGQALILPLTAQQTDAVSAADLRSIFLGQDPVAAAQQGSSDIEIVSFNPVTTGSGLRGSRVVLNMKVDDKTWSTYDQTTLMDAAGSKVYAFEVRCESTCFKQNHDRIDQIVQSWQVKK
jgi:hypothetical protein